MQYSEDAVIYVMVDTTEGIRYLFYTPSHVRGLLHGFERGIMHGLGGAIVDGRWRCITRDLESDLKDAEPNNQLLAVNGIIFRGSGRVDNIILYTPSVESYEDGESGIVAWQVSDSEPDGAIVEVGSDSVQGNYIVFDGEGFDNAYTIGAIQGARAWENREEKILQWRFKSFGDEVEVMESGGVIRDEKVFEFRIFVETQMGNRELSYTLGLSHLGIIEDSVIHHGLGDDRTRGSVLIGSGNTLGLWQTITRDVEEDIRDFEPNNRLIAINGMQVRGSGFVDDIQALSSVE